MTGGPGSKTRTKQFLVPYHADSREHALLKFTRTAAAINCSDAAKWRVELEFNPQKAGPVGLKRIKDSWEDIFVGQAPLDPLLKDFEISRVDAAVDLIGVFPIDLIVRVSKLGKRVV